jgi:hypothetical protein
MFGRGVRKAGGRQFTESVIQGISADMTHLYLMFRPDGTIIVKWERPRGDRRRQFRITADTDGNACPHCAVLLAIDKIGDVLALGDYRVERVRDEYLSLLEQKLLPCPAFGRSPSVDTPFGSIPLIIGGDGSGWAAECHAGDGDPSTPADCARHRSA